MMSRRWRLVRCFQDEVKEERERKAQSCIEKIKNLGYPAKIWVPLPQHQTSGHIHIVALCTFEELFKVGGVYDRYMNVQGRRKLVTRDISEEKMNEIAESLRKARGFFYVDEPNGPYYEGKKND